MALGLWIYSTLEPTPATASFLTPQERDFLTKKVRTNKVCKIKPYFARWSVRPWVLSLQPCPTCIGLVMLDNTEKSP